MNGKAYTKGPIAIYDISPGIRRFDCVTDNPGLIKSDAKGLNSNTYFDRAYAHMFLQRLPTPRIVELLSAMTTGIIQSDGRN